MLVCSTFLSIFFGRATAEDLLEKITDEIDNSQLGLEKLIDLSTDGPNINISLYNLFIEFLKERGLHGLLPLVSCTLHVIHNGFRKDGNEAEELAFALYY